uniref:Uncharacterized protein n=1 Tax=Alexandrium monilatum TaxID=311494 RepID=A0A7S4UWT6_9DINO
MLGPASAKLLQLSTHASRCAAMVSRAQRRRAEGLVLLPHKASGDGVQPLKPNRSSLVDDGAVNTRQCSERLKVRIPLRNQLTWPELLDGSKPPGGAARCARGSLGVMVKMDIEGSERDVILEAWGPLKASFAQLGRRWRLEEGADLELLVYYHVDKYPLLRDLDRFLTSVEREFETVIVEWTPMVPDGDKEPVGSEWYRWREKVRQSDGSCLRGKTDIGLASAKKDILVACAGLRGV